MVVTLDGPAGTGKSTIAKRLARELGFRFLDTGAMYRALAWRCLVAGVDLTSDAAVTSVALEIRIEFVDERVLVNGVDATEAIREPAVTQAASIVAAVPGVRSRMVDWQREYARQVDLVTEGRDQGTVAFPAAECKFFLIASPEERARRRQRELAGQGLDVPFEEILRQQSERDERDRTRACAPLRPADDAVTIDTSDLSVVEIVQRLLREVDARGNGASGSSVAS